MSTESDFNTIVNIEPFWVMTHNICFYCDASHKSKSFIKISKFKFLENSISLSLFKTSSYMIIKYGATF